MSEEEYAEIVDWFYSLEEEWDRQIEEDAVSGRLDFFKEQVMEAEKNGTLGYL